MGYSARKDDRGNMRKRNDKRGDLQDLALELAILVKIAHLFEISDEFVVDKEKRIDTLLATLAPDHLAGFLGLGIAPDDGDLLATAKHLAGADHLSGLLLDDGAAASRGIDHNLLVSHCSLYLQRKNRIKESVTQLIFGKKKKKAIKEERKSAIRLQE